MTDNEIIKSLGELAKIAPTPYLFDVCKSAANRIVELNRDLDFARTQNRLLTEIITDEENRNGKKN